jgi:hypothetical protein
MGDAIMFVPVNTTISNEYQVTYEGHTFRVVGVMDQMTAFGSHYKQAHLKKLH